MRRRYYFTFGSNHRFLGLLSLGNYWVEVIVEVEEGDSPDISYLKARRIFCELFADKFTGGQSVWSFQYPEDDWDNTEPSMYFIKGPAAIIVNNELKFFIKPEILSILESTEIEYSLADPTSWGDARNLFGDEISQNTEGLIYLCDYDYDNGRLIPRKAIHVDDAFNALDIYANTPNPASQLAMKTKTRTFIEELHFSFIPRC